MVSCTALAEAYAEQGDMQEAKKYADLALEVTTQTDDKYLCGMVYATLGKITHAEALLVHETERQHLLHESISWLQKSVVQLTPTQAFRDLAQVYTSLATAYEEVVHPQEALAYWKLAYAETEKAKNIPCACL